MFTATNRIRKIYLMIIAKTFEIKKKYQPVETKKY